MIDIGTKTKEEILLKYDFTCQKCGFKDIQGLEVVVHVIPTEFKDRPLSTDMLIVLCKICHDYTPKEERYFKKYLAERVDGSILNTYRNAQKTLSSRTKEGMKKKKQQGIHVSRPPKGYKIIDGILTIEESQAEELRRIFREFAESTISLGKLSAKYNISKPGLIKILKNTVYREGYSGTMPIIEPTLFAKVHQKLSKNSTIPI